MLFYLTEVKALRRLIGYSLVCVALGILITLFINSTVLLVILAGALLLIGYQLFCCWLIIFTGGMCIKKEAERISFFLDFRKMNYARSTFPDFRHLAQTYCVLVPPFTLQRTDLMFDLNILFDLLWEWLTLFPKWAPFPHTAHFAMTCTSLSGFQK